MKQTTEEKQFAKQALKLLELGDKLAVPVLDEVVETFYKESGGGDKHQVAHKVLLQLKDIPEAWRQVDSILEQSSSRLSKFLALQILESLVCTRWKILPRSRCEGIKKYVVDLIIQTASEPNLSSKDKAFLAKLNIILVQIVKKEWPHRWTNFIQDLVVVCEENEALCQNNMAILRLLSEEIFDCPSSHGNLTKAQSLQLRRTICDHFPQVFRLLMFILEQNSPLPLLSEALSTLLHLLSWIPLGFIFETRLLTLLASQFLKQEELRSQVLMCLTEIAGITASQYTDKFNTLISLVLKEIIPQDGEEEVTATSQEETHFLTTFLRHHGDDIQDEPETWNKCLRYLVAATSQPSTTPMCLEYWGFLLENPPSTLHPGPFSQLRQVLLEQMVAPESQAHEDVQLYRAMKEVLVHLTQMDPKDTEQILTRRLNLLKSPKGWSLHRLNTLCWTVGAICGSHDQENNFVISLLQDLLVMCDKKRNKVTKAAIASNIMYLVGQYPQFLRAHWKFLKAILLKLFEFMHVSHEGVQDMSCDTFLKIAIKCRRHFVKLQPGEGRAFLEEIVENLNSIIHELQVHQVHTFYEAVGHMVAIAGNKGELLEQVMALPNQVWREILFVADKDKSILKDVDVVKQIWNILRINIRVCSAIKEPFVSQLTRIYGDVIRLYSTLSEVILKLLQGGEAPQSLELLRTLHEVRRESLVLLSTWVSSPISDFGPCHSHFLPPFMEVVLTEYQTCPVPSAREPEVLETLTILVHCLKGHLSQQIPEILRLVFESTLQMINKDLEEYPDHRTHFFHLLQAIVTHTFPALLTLPPSQFKLLLDSVVWGFKHTIRSVADIGLQVLSQVLQAMAEQPPEVAQPFYQLHFTNLLQHLFAVATDPALHASGFPSQCALLASMFQLVDEGGRVQGLLSKDHPSNRAYLESFVTGLLETAFPHLHTSQVTWAVQGFFTHCKDSETFKDHFRDFLVQIGEFADDPSPPAKKAKSK